MVGSPAAPPTPAARGVKGAGRRPPPWRRRVDQEKIRPSGILAAPELVFTPHPDATEEDLEHIRKQHPTAVIAERPVRAPERPSGPNPLAGVDDVASAEIVGGVVKLVVYDDSTMQTAALAKIARDLAKHHGVTYERFETRVVPRPV